MPPKKPEKKDDKNKDLSDPIPKNECIFNIEFEIFHEKGHYVRLKYNWINEGNFLNSCDYTNILHLF